MVRGLTQWTKTLSFPARVSPQRPSKEAKVFQVSPSVSPTSPPSPIGDNIEKPAVINEEVSARAGRRQVQTGIGLETLLGFPIPMNLVPSIGKYIPKY